jgi:hypothetical protein
MPYGTQYTYSPTTTGVYPSEYVYYPTYGWTWVTAPWVFGWGIQPFFGVYGPGHYGWYSRAIGYGGWRGYGYGRVYGAGYRGYGYGGGVYRPAYGGYRAGFAAPHTYGYGAAGHVYRGAPAYGGGWRGAPAGGGFHAPSGGFHGGGGGAFHGGGGGFHGGGGGFHGGGHGRH